MRTAELSDPIENKRQEFQVGAVFKQIVDGHLWSQILRFNHSQKGPIMPFIFRTQSA